MIYKDYYKILDLKTSRVSIDEIKVAYRAAAKKYHPDLNVGDSLAEERIKDINEAYRTLSVPASKRKYDRIWNSRNNINNYQKIKGKNIFNMFLGNTEINEETDRKLPQRGEDIETEINISLEDGFYGTNKTIVFKDLETKDKTITIKLPEGVQEKERIRLIGQGKSGKNGGKNGDLFIKIDIENEKNFKLDGINISTIIPITPWEAVLGTKAKVESIDGTKTQIYIPNGSQSGEIIEIPNKGYKNTKGERGKLIGKLEIVIPEKITTEEKEMFKKLKEISKFNPRSI